MEYRIELEWKDEDYKIKSYHSRADEKSPWEDIKDRPGGHSDLEKAVIDGAMTIQHSTEESEEKPTKDRLLAEHYFDGVYIGNEKTKFGGRIKELKELPNDLKKLLIT